MSLLINKQTFGPFEDPTRAGLSVPLAGSYRPLPAFVFSGGAYDRKWRVQANLSKPQRAALVQPFAYGSPFLTSAFVGYTQREENYVLR